MKNRQFTGEYTTPARPDLRGRGRFGPAGDAPYGPRVRDDHGFALAVLSLLAAIPISAIAVVNAGVLGLLVALAAIVLINVAYRH